MNDNWRKRLKAKLMAEIPRDKTLNNTSNLNDEYISDYLDGNENRLRSIYKDCSDVIYRPFLIGKRDKALLIYIDGLSTIEEIDAHVHSPLMNHQEIESYHISHLIEEIISVSSVKEIKTISECIKEISIGNPIILADGQTTIRLEILLRCKN